MGQVFEGFIEITNHHMKNKYLLIAGILCMVTAFLHLISGQASLVSPLLISNTTDQVKGEWIGVWHMVTIILFYSAWILLRPFQSSQVELLKFLGKSFIAFGLVFVMTSLYFGLLTPQFILLIPIGVLILMEVNRLKVLN